MKCRSTENADLPNYDKTRNSAVSLCNNGTPLSSFLQFDQTRSHFPYVPYMHSAHDLPQTV
jgi:hypothetical protein